MARGADHCQCSQHGDPHWECCNSHISLGDTDCSATLKPDEFYQKSYLAVALGSTSKTDSAITFGTGPTVTHAPNNQTTEPRQRFVSGLRPASSPDARSGLPP